VFHRALLLATLCITFTRSCFDRSKAWSYYSVEKKRRSPALASSVPFRSVPFRSVDNARLGRRSSMTHSYSRGWSAVARFVVVVVVVAAEEPDENSTASPSPLVSIVVDREKQARLQLRLPEPEALVRRPAVVVLSPLARTSLFVHHRINAEVHSTRRRAYPQRTTTPSVVASNSSCRAIFRTRTCRRTATRSTIRTRCFRERPAVGTYWTRSPSPSVEEGAQQDRRSRPGGMSRILPTSTGPKVPCES